MHLFTNIVKEHIRNARENPKLKGKLIGIYTSELKKNNIDTSMGKWREPQIAPTYKGGLSWVDYILQLNDEEFELFMLGLNK